MAQSFGNKPNFIKGKQQFQRSPQCFRCGRQDHNTNSCKFKNQTCHICNNRGHISTVCRKDGQPWGSEQNVKILDHAFSDPVSSEQDDDEHTLYKLNTDVHSHPIMTPMKWNDSKVHHELSTGASVSVIPEQTWRNSLTSVQDSRVTLETYSGEKLKF